MMPGRWEGVDTTAKALIATLNAHPGEKFYSSELATLTHKEQGTITTLLCWYYKRCSHGLMRDQLSNPAKPRERFRYWLPPSDGSAPAPDPAAPAKEISPLAAKIAQWFRLHHRSARPSIVAAALKEDPKAVARELERLRRARAAHRCTLLNRHGVDRHEYRPVGAAPPMSGAL